MKMLYLMTLIFMSSGEYSTRTVRLRPNLNNDNNTNVFKLTSENVSCLGYS